MRLLHVCAYMFATSPLLVFHISQRAFSKCPDHTDLERVPNFFPSYYTKQIIIETLNTVSAAFSGFILTSSMFLQYLEKFRN